MRISAGRPVPPRDGCDRARTDEGARSTPSFSSRLALYRPSSICIESAPSCRCRQQIRQHRYYHRSNSLTSTSMRRPGPPGSPRASSPALRRPRPLSPPVPSTSPRALPSPFSPSSLSLPVSQSSSSPGTSFGLFVPSPTLAPRAARLTPPVIVFLLQRLSVLLGPPRKCQSN